MLGAGEAALPFCALYGNSGGNDSFCCSNVSKCHDVLYHILVQYECSRHQQHLTIGKSLNNFYYGRSMAIFLIAAVEVFIGILTGSCVYLITDLSTRNSVACNLCPLIGP